MTQDLDSNPLFILNIQHYATLNIYWSFNNSNWLRDLRVIQLPCPITWDEDGRKDHGIFEKMIGIYS